MVSYVEHHRSGIYRHSRHPLSSLEPQTERRKSSRQSIQPTTSAASATFFTPSLSSVTESDVCLALILYSFLLYTFWLMFLVIFTGLKLLCITYLWALYDIVWHCIWTRFELCLKWVSSLLTAVDWLGTSKKLLGYVCVCP